MSQKNKISVFVKDFMVDAFIGVYSHEKNHKQPLRISCRATLQAKTALDDNINETFSYEVMIALINQIANGPHIDLVEVFAEKLADSCMAYPIIQDVTVSVEKPGVFAHGLVGTEIFKTKA